MMNTQLLKRILLLGVLSSLALPVWALTKIAAMMPICSTQGVSILPSPVRHKYLGRAPVSPVILRANIYPLP